MYFNILEKHKNTEVDRIVNVNKEITSNHMFPSGRSKTSTRYTICENMFDGKNFWLIKPTDYNRGRGVEVFHTLEQFKKLILEY